MIAAQLPEIGAGGVRKQHEDQGHFREQVQDVVVDRQVEQTGHLGADDQAEQAEEQWPGEEGSRYLSADETVRH